MTFQEQCDDARSTISELERHLQKLKDFLLAECEPGFDLTEWMGRNQ